MFRTALANISMAELEINVVHGLFKYVFFVLKIYIGYVDDQRIIY